eukprot:6878653-Prymnesium_polylepis.2
MAPPGRRSRYSTRGCTSAGSGSRPCQAVWYVDPPAACIARSDDPGGVGRTRRVGHALGRALLRQQLTDAEQLTAAA